MNLTRMLTSICVYYLRSCTWSNCNNRGLQHFTLGFFWDQYTTFCFRFGCQPLNQHTVEHGDKFFKGTSLKKKKERKEINHEGRYAVLCISRCPAGQFKYICQLDKWIFGILQNIWNDQDLKF